MKNYYEELEVSKTASKEVIEKVYKVLAKKYHPDTTKEIDKQAAEEKFKIISEAYDVLSDDEKRKKYDIELEQINPTVSYEEYMNVINQRDNINNAFNELRNEFFEFKNSYNTNNAQNQYYQNFNDGFNNYQRPNTNYNNQDYNNNNVGQKGKKYYYNTITGEPVSALDYYKYKIRKFISNIGFYLLLILVLIFAFKRLSTSMLGNLFS